MSSPMRMLMVMDSCRVEPTRPSPQFISQRVPFTESSTIALLYMGHTAEAKPSAKPRIPLIRRTYQKFATRIARIGNMIPIIAMICRDYTSTEHLDANSPHSPFIRNPYTKRGSNRRKHQNSRSKQSLFLQLPPPSQT